MPPSLAGWNGSQDREPSQPLPEASGKPRLVHLAEPLVCLGLRLGDDLGSDADLHGLVRSGKGGEVVGEPDDWDGVGDQVDGEDEISQGAYDHRLRPRRRLRGGKCVVQHQGEVYHLGSGLLGEAFHLGPESVVAVVGGVSILSTVSSAINNKLLIIFHNAEDLKVRQCVAIFSRRSFAVRPSYGNVTGGFSFLLLLIVFVVNDGAKILPFFYLIIVIARFNGSQN